jgi:hypothetical protein
MTIRGYLASFLRAAQKHFDMFALDYDHIPYGMRIFTTDTVQRVPGTLESRILCATIHTPKAIALCIYWRCIRTHSVLQWVREGGVGRIALLVFGTQGFVTDHDTPFGSKDGFNDGKVSLFTFQAGQASKEASFSDCFLFFRPFGPHITADCPMGR